MRADDRAAGQPVPYLHVDGLTVDYGPIRALDQVSVSVTRGEIVAVLGANGAGKSSLLRSISGIVKPSSGEIVVDGTRVRGQSADRIARRGITHVPEGRRIFAGLSVRENLILGAVAARRMDGAPEMLERVHAMFPVLAERSQQLGWSLSGGEAQMLAVGRALMARPSLLMLDEPSFGLAPLIVRELLATVARIRDEGCTILLVEQNARAALRIADRAYIFRGGRVAFAGTSDEIKDSPEVKAAYLGG
jgi:branched-chain amino acid transport system ATP-binding protein